MRSTRNDAITPANGNQAEFFNGILEFCTRQDLPRCSNKTRHQVKFCCAIMPARNAIPSPFLQRGAIGCSSRPVPPAFVETSTLHLVPLPNRSFINHDAVIHQPSASRNPTGQIDSIISRHRLRVAVEGTLGFFRPLRETRHEPRPNRAHHRRSLDLQGVLQ
jgi:hypothetical protein